MSRKKLSPNGQQPSCNAADAHSPVCLSAPPAPTHGPNWAELASRVVAWLLTLSFWKAILGLVILIFAWRIANHYFP